MAATAQEPSAASLAPQLQAYQKLGRSMRWLPFLMFSQGGGVRSEVVNTDCYGFRWSTTQDGEIASVETPGEGPCGLTVGGSTTFGIGATNDAGTLASALAATTGRPWLNLGARGHGSTQELLGFLMYADRLPPVAHVVLMSGVNDIYLQYAANRFDEQLGAFLYSDRFFEALESVRQSSALERLRALVVGNTEPADQRPLDELIAEREGRRGRTLALLRRNLSHWAALAAARSARVTFALQPTLPWMGKKPNREERVLLSTREAQDSRHERLVTHTLSSENHEWFCSAVEPMCAELGLGFVDLNAALRRRVGDDEWIFVDRAHLTDRGYSSCAASLAEFTE